MAKRTRLGDLQLAIMRQLWARQEATVADVHQALQRERGLALTTVATMLKKMEKKGVVEHRLEGRRFVYRPSVSEEAVTRSMVSDLTTRLFDGEPAALASFLIRNSDISSAELAALKAQIAAAEGEEGS